MRGYRGIFIVIVCSFVSVALQSPLRAAPNSAKVGVSSTVKTTGISKEKRDRQVDRAALSSQKQSIEKLIRLKRRHKSRRQEPLFLIRLAEMYQQEATFYFRIAHGESNKTDKKRQFASHKTSMKNSIKNLDSLIEKYPGFSELDHAYFMRGKANEEIKNIQGAKKDYLALVTRFPNSSHVLSAYMSLAEFAMEINQYQPATSYLHQIEKHPESSHYPFALYKLAWSYYNLKDIPKATFYIKNHIHFYDFRKEKQQVLTTSDESIRETSLLDSTLFYLEGFEQKDSDFRLDNALSFFKDLEKGKSLGKMLVRFTVLLRAHDHDAELIKWKNEIIKREFQTPESVDVVMKVLEHQLKKYSYQEVSNVVGDFYLLYQKNHKLKSFESYQKVQLQLLNAAKELRGLAIKNKKATKVGVLTQALSAVYTAFSMIVDNADPRIPGVRYNLAETHFETKKYEKATENYRWVLGNWNPKSRLKKKEIYLKAISSRYEVLRQKKLIPNSVKATHIKNDIESVPDGLMADWVQWIDEYDSRWGRKYDKTFANFQLEANRALYQQGFIKKSVARMLKEVKQHPQSRYAIPSAALSLDTYVESGLWNKAHQLAGQFRKVAQWKKSPFAKGLLTVESDAYYKMIEDFSNSGYDEKALDLVKRFRERYSESKRYPDGLYLASNIAIRAKNKVKAIEYLSELVLKYPEGVHVIPAYLAKAQIAEESYNFSDASKAYFEFLSLANKDPSTRKEFKKLSAEKVVSKILVLSWLSGDKKLLKKYLVSPRVCDGTNIDECDQYQALNALEGAGNITSIAALKKSVKAPKPTRSIWAAIALQKELSLNYNDRNLALKLLAGRWGELEPAIQFAVLPSIRSQVPNAFRANRKDIDRFNPVKTTAKSIEGRIVKIKELEDVASDVVKNIPWAGIRAELLNETAELYFDLVKALKNAGKSQAEKDEMVRLVFPFEEKAQELRNSAFEMASKFAIRSTDFSRIRNPFFRDNPSQAKALRGEILVDFSVPISLSLLDRLEGSVEWKKTLAMKNSDNNYYADPARYVKVQWAKAMQVRNWPQVSFFVQEAEKKQIFDKGSLEILKAISFSQAGVEAEALAALEKAREKLEGSSRSQTTLILVSHYLRAHSKGKTETLLESLVGDSGFNGLSALTRSDDESFVLAYAADWVGMKLSRRAKRDLLKAAGDSKSSARAAWAIKERQDMARSSK